MEKFFTVGMYLLWIVTLIGVLTITFTNFQYEDLNVIVAVLGFFTAINTIFTVKR